MQQEPPRPGDQRYTLADTAKLHRHLGWEPRTQLDDGLAQQWAWQERELAPPAASPLRTPVLVA